MRAGLLSEKITFLESTMVKDEFGAVTKQWVETFSTRAQVTFQNGNRINQNNEIFFNATTSFTIRWYNKILEQMQILWRHDKYRIISISRDRTKQSITINTEKINE